MNVSKATFLILFLCIVILLFSCKPQENTTKTVISPTQEVAFNVIKTGNNSGYETVENIQIYSLSELENVWSQLYANYSRKAPDPVIDFEKNMLIAVTMGEKKFRRVFN